MAVIKNCRKEVKEFPRFFLIDFFQGKDHPYYKEIFTNFWAVKASEDKKWIVDEIMRL
jgi:hypothetical protein